MEARASCRQIQKWAADTHFMVSILFSICLIISDVCRFAKSENYDAGEWDGNKIDGRSL